MVSTWFKHYGNLSNENIPAVFSDPHKNIKLSTEPDFPHTAPEGMARIVVEGGRDADKIGCTLQIASSTSPGANDQLSSLEISSPGIPDFEVKMPKKRKNATSELQPWHIEINQQYDIRKLIRMAERDWVQSTNRLTEKIENESTIRDDRNSLLRSRKRLKLTSLLMQRLVPAMPASLLKEPAFKACENIIYLVARQGLGNACGLVSGFKNVLCEITDGLNMAPGKLKDYVRSGDPSFLKNIENMLERVSKFEMTLSRLENSSLLDVRLECEDIERISMINMLIKFHGRAQMNGVTNSMSEMNPNLFVQRHITRRPMHSNAIELRPEVNCLSL